MNHRTTVQTRADQFLIEMTQRMTPLIQQLSTWVQSEPRTLADMEQHVLRVVKDLGTALLNGLCTLLPPRYPAPELPCPCGACAQYVRDRPAQVRTILGPLRLTRAYYLCPTCRHGFAPLDQQLQLCAGSMSACLEELLALLGAREDSFEAAVPILDKLTLVTVCPNSIRAATERLGDTIAEEEQQTTDAALAAPVAAPRLGRAPACAPSGPRIYVSMDGTTVHTRVGWKEAKLGAIYTTTSRVPPTRPDTLEIRTHAPSFVADLAAPEAFGALLWAEAHRRGITATTEVVAIGDGAHWIWNLIEQQFPTAVQIVDWYHASQYVWQVAHACYGEGTDQATAWATTQLDRLWDGQGADVLTALKMQTGGGTAVASAISYYTNNLHRMRYDHYRAQGMQIGSGTIESGCKHVIGARLKQAGMIWDVAGARAVAKVRARLKSGRWDETIQRRPPLRRTYHHQALT